MTPNKLVAVGLIAVGCVLLYFGWQSSQSVVDQVSETLTGRFTDDTMWLVIGGAAAVVVGVVLLVSGKTR